MMGGSNKGAMLFGFGVMIVCILSIVGGGSFSLLWIQHEVSKVAKQTVLLEKRHQEMLRKLDYLDERIANAHQPIVLQSKVSNRLVPIMDDQIVWVETTATGAGNAYVNAQNTQSDIFNNQVR
tara:strand:- start:18 stop:386 length:369 start_codon:yes stop_codon:yes gene_type:complete